MKALIVVLWGVIFVLIACSNENDSREIPTLIPESEAETQPEKDEPTPTQEIILTPTVRSLRPTLPPTWTPTLPPTQAPTETPAPTDAADAQSEDVVIADSPAQIGESPECEGFGPDTLLTTGEFDIGTVPTVAWRSVSTASVYWLLILDVVTDPENPTILREEYITATRFDIPADTFRSPGRYGWEVRPLDQAGIQMCYGRGELLIAK